MQISKKEEGFQLFCLFRKRNLNGDWSCFSVIFFLFRLWKIHKWLTLILTTDLFDISGWFLFERSKVLFKTVVVTRHWAVDLYCFTNQSSWSEGCTHQVQFLISGRVRGKARNSACEWIRFMMLDHSVFISVFIFLPLNLFMTKTEDCYNAGLPEETCSEYLKWKFLEILFDENHSCNIAQWLFSDTK